jgi:hypothetical protein
LVAPSVCDDVDLDGADELQRSAKESDIWIEVRSGTEVDQLSRS